jgi:hypothetical protein
VRRKSRRQDGHKHQPADADNYNDVGYDDKAMHNDDEHDDNITYNNISQVALQLGRHQRE